MSLCAHGIFSAHNTLDLLTKGFHGRGLATSWNALSTSAVADTTTTWNTMVLDAKACARSTNRLHADGHTGKWSPEEETRLNSIMQEMHESGKRPDTTPKFWKEVSRRMDNTRAAKQCSNKWYVHPGRLANMKLTSIIKDCITGDTSLAGGRLASPYPEVCGQPPPWLKLTVH